MLLVEKNQKYPVSPVSAAAVPTPLVPWDGTRQLTWALNRPPFKHSVCASTTQGPVAPAASSETKPDFSAAGAAAGFSLTAARSDRATTVRALNRLLADVIMVTQRYVAGAGIEAVLETLEAREPRSPV